ncbi:MAG TPA: YidC/Oxa1 family membrane protein insertase [Saprospiraceae bacterium]|nr:YidC/Oxa1 family membrane protein insertase [Saprospiraceae bacterium]
MESVPFQDALYRFFPASITFRKEPFLWADDLSTYDNIANLPFEIPFFGAHISLFTILWAVSTVIYTYYSTKNVDMSANPAMKYVQYVMPVMFLGFFNSYASGLTAYMFFSNLINILQIIITKNFIFDNDKIRKELEIAKTKPKKKSAFQARLEEAMKQQQEVAAKKSKG